MLCGASTPTYSGSGRGWVYEEVKRGNVPSLVPRTFTFRPLNPEGARVQDVPVHTSVEGVVPNTHTSEFVHARAVTPDDVVNSLGAVLILYPRLHDCTPTTNNGSDSDFGRGNGSLLPLPQPPPLSRQTTWSHCHCHQRKLLFPVHLMRPQTQSRQIH